MLGVTTSFDLYYDNHHVSVLNLPPHVLSISFVKQVLVVYLLLPLSFC